MTDIQRFEERLDLVRAEVITDGLELGRVGTRCEPVGELGVLETALLGLALGPFMPVYPLRAPSSYVPLGVALEFSAADDQRGRA